MADAGGGGSSWGALEIILVAVLAIGFMGQLQNGFSSSGDAPRTKAVETQEPAPCGLVLARPHAQAKLQSSITLTGRIEGCDWRATESVALYAQVIDAAGKPLTPYTTIPVINYNEGTGAFDTTIPFITQPGTSKGFLLLIPAQSLDRQAAPYRIPIGFTRT